MVFQGPFLLKVLLLLKWCGFPRSAALLLSLRMGLVLYVLKETEGSVARIDISEEDTHNLSRREIYFQSKGIGRIQGLSFILGGFQRLNQWKSKGHFLLALGTQRRSFHCKSESNRKQVQKEKVLCRALPEVRERSRKSNLLPWFSVWFISEVISSIISHFSPMHIPNCKCFCYLLKDSCFLKSLLCLAKNI